MRGGSFSPRPSAASPTARRLPRTAAPVTGRLRSPPYPAAAPAAPRPGPQRRARCADRREDVTATGADRRALSGLAPPTSTVLRIPQAGRAYGALLTLEPLPAQAGLTARARPKARPEAHAANLTEVCQPAIDSKSTGNTPCHSYARTGQKPGTLSGTRTTNKPALTSITAVEYRPKIDMVRRRSTVRFRNGAPAQRVISNAAVQDPVTRFQDPVTSIALTGLHGAT